MSRARNIKPGFFKNDLLAECNPLARILFAGLWCEADRDGRLEDRPKRLKAECLAYDECDCDALLQELADRNFIVRYECNGSRYIAICEFSKHQNPHCKEQVSSIPAPNEHSASTVKAQCKTDARTEVAGLIPDSLIPDSMKELQGGSADAEPRSPTRIDSIPYQAIVDAFNERLTGLAKVRSLTNPRKTAIRSAWNSLPPEHRKIGAMKAIFAECQMDDFLNGNGPYSGEHANWRPDFDHLIKLKTVTKVYEKAMARRDRMRQEQAATQTGAAA